MTVDSRYLGQGVRQIYLAAAVFVFVVIIWHVTVISFKVQPIILPSPLRVASVAWTERLTLAKAFWATGTAAFYGLGMSVSMGCLVAIVFSQSMRIRAAFYPYVIFLQTVPIIAIAPLLITWFGYGFGTIVKVSMIISLFPIISNVTAGLLSVDQNLLDLFRLHRASRWQVLWKLRIPSAVSHLVLGMRISAGLAVIGAIVGEMFVGYGSSDYAGLGAIMTQWQRLARTDAIMAAVFASTLLGITTLAIVNLMSRVLLSRWTYNLDFEQGSSRP